MISEEDEMAEAALLLAHVDAEGASMPEPLKKAILRDAVVVSTEIRHSTTKAGAIAIETLPPEALPTRSFLRTWGGWFAAAACFALAVYQWRVRTIETEPSSRAAAAALAPVEGATLALRDATGAVAELAWDARARSGTLRLVRLPANGAGEQYQLWISDGPSASAAPAGAFRCESACTPQAFTAKGPASMGTVRRAWLTRADIGASVSPLDETRLVAEGAVDGPR